MRSRVLIVIPARYGAVRFPGKPLAMVAGVPLVERVRRLC
ncbi:MAG: 3-deoxy-manno-octulosonate cytidylyltransferase, partial [Verrucomicrobiae bacterium]|nr:3-deoxy-manno-octulosonate cytidylyltransferase [Verrucomicrobiae bacterium]